MVGTLLLYSSPIHSLTYLLTVYLRLTSLFLSWPLDPPLANVLRMGWAEAHTERPPFAAILEKVTAHHQQACIFYLFTLHYCMYGGHTLKRTACAHCTYILAEGGHELHL